MAIYIWPYNNYVKTTVELPDGLLRDTRKFAADRGKTFKEVLIEGLNLLVYDGNFEVVKPGWEALFGAFAGDPEIGRIQQFIDEEYSRVDPEDWK